MIELDNTDRKLISLLRHNAREPIATLAKKLCVSRATARSRIERLVTSGVIEQFTITMGAPAQDRLIKAIMMVSVDGTRSDHVIRELNKVPEIVRIYSTSGHWDSIVMLEVDNLQRFDDVLRAISRITGVKSSETSLMLTSRRIAK